ncbi:MULTISPECIES: PRC-barrel domain-containing protein [Streptomyces]|uniref:PRC-barrel domain-containing protein n=1 Tax=Streptomyces TaxID=1883 RepID=UPI00163D32EE|nr:MULTISPECIES: PRC-barrel domain-containing protein [Streptomyces]MBC2876556.1 PRC-barrel domain-containing protein [Streptomyces sp. TYQ1024]UBI40773.1 PRC-barrel domain-containing protein [Streptomyces mobaraensis]UKW33353.1 PRC-barrel domain-containing protein [Streptomyces sp. TYQ1024]
MDSLMLASELAKRPVVTLDGEAVAEIKDTVFDGAAGQITGFTLNGRGLLAGPLKQSLPWSSVHALGRHAVMIPGREALAEPAAVVASGEAAHGAVPGAKVLTEEGVEAGSVLDVVVAPDGRVVGFRISATEAFVHREHGRNSVFVPRGEALAVSGRALVVPSDAPRFVADDLPSFTTQVELFAARVTAAERQAYGGQRTDVGAAEGKEHL